MAARPSQARAWSLRLLAPFVPGDRETSLQEVVTAIVRILFGVMVIHQLVDAFGFAMVDEAERRVRVLAALGTAGGLMLSVGLATPVAIGGLLVYFAWMPVAFNLGTMVSVVLLWGLLLHGAGRTLSLDAALLRRPVLGKGLSRLYAWTSVTDPWNLARVRFLIFFLYWGQCATAVLFHASDSFWLKGQVLQVAFTAPYMCDHYAWIAAVRDRYPDPYSVFCKLGLIVQGVWELFLLPLMYFRWTRVFVFVQGLGFFITSLLLLNLQYLPVVELLLWALLWAAPLLAWTRNGQPVGEPSPAPVLTAFITLACLLTVLQVMLGTGLIPALSRAAAPVTYRLVPAFSLLGQAPIMVFNRQDLEMNNSHLVLEEVDTAGRQLRVVPFQDLEGGRLDYLRNDVLYFNHSLPWQRASWQAKFVEGDPTRPGRLTHLLARKVARLDAVLTGPTRPRHYRAHVYVREMLLKADPPRWSDARQTASFMVDLTPQDQTAWGPTFEVPPGQAFSQDRLRRTEAALARQSP